MFQSDAATCGGLISELLKFLKNGGPFYPLLTGRRDSTLSFPEVAEYELPSPQDDLETILAAFASRGFDKREAVALLGNFSSFFEYCGSTFPFHVIYGS